MSLYVVWRINSRRGSDLCGLDGAADGRLRWILC